MRGAIAILLLLPALPAAAVDDPYRFKILLGGGYELGTPSFDQRLSFSQFQETATVTTSYETDKAAGVDLAIQYRAFRNVGFAIGGTLYDRDRAGSFEASFPHPLFFDQPRRGEGSTPKGSLKERAGHVSLVAFGNTGSLDVSGWAGVSFFKVEADLITTVDYSQSYPYDSVTITTTPSTKVSDSPIGFNLGASVDWRFSRSVGFGVQGRFARAKAKFPVPNASDAEVDAGGFQAGGGIRFYF